MRRAWRSTRGLEFNFISTGIPHEYDIEMMNVAVNKNTNNIKEHVILYIDKDEL